MFDWIGDALDWVGDKLSSAGEAISEAVWDIMLEWIFDTVYGAIAEFFAMINGMGADIFDLAWVDAFLQLFSLFGWALFAAGLVVAVFDTAIEYQTGRANIQSTCLNVLKGFMAVSLFTKVIQVLHHIADNFFRRFNWFICGCNSRRFRRNGRSSIEKHGRIFRVVRAADHYHACVLRCKIVLCKHQTGRYFAMSDRCGKSVYVLHSERIFRRFQRLVQANFCPMSDGVFADLADVSGTADMADQYAAGTWNYACGE